MTEIRDENGYEWYPTNDVAATIRHGTAQVVRAFDSRVLATLFTHAYYIHDISSSNWRAILQGISANLAGYGPISMTMDDACRYVRALTTSGITSGTYDAGRSDRCSTVLTGEHGRHHLLLALHRQRRPDQRVASQRPAVLGLRRWSRTR